MKYKRCAHGLCNSDTRYSYKPYMQGVTFHPFPSAIKAPERRLQWAVACNRLDFNVGCVKKTSFICSKHFIDPGGPSTENPNPLLATAAGGSNRSRRKLRTVFSDASVNAKGKFTDTAPISLGQSITSEPQPPGMTLKNNQSMRRHNPPLLTQPPVRPKANSLSTNDLFLNQSRVEGSFTGTSSTERNRSKLQQENSVLIVPGYEGILPNSTSCLVKEEPEEIVIIDEEDDTNHEFNPQLQSSMEMIFECEDQQRDRDPTVSHDDLTVGTKDVLTLFEDTRLSLTGLRTCYEDEITKRNKQIEDLKKQIEELKRKKRECRFCHLISNASPEVTIFMKNLLSAMEARKDSPIQNNESQYLLCHSSADVNAQATYHNGMCLCLQRARCQMDSLL